MSELTWLPGLPVELITAAYSGAPGNEIASGKMSSAESSSALVANTFGYFLGQPAALPALPSTERMGWPAVALALEALVRFPWAGGKHPCLDVLVTTGSSLIGIESKRYEPFRPHSAADLSDAYWRPVWGPKMAPYELLRDDINAGGTAFVYLDAVQLIKHAFGLRTAVQEGKVHTGKQPVLFYLHAEPATWPDGRPIGNGVHALHRKEVEEFKSRVANSEVLFHSCSYSELLTSWLGGDNTLERHAAAVRSAFNP